MLLRGKDGHVSGFILLIPILIFTFYMALIFESTGIALLGFTAALFGVLSFIGLLLNVRKVSVKLLIPIELAEKGRPFWIKAQIQNNAFLPVGKLRIYVEYGESHAQKKDVTVLTFRNVPAGKSIQGRTIRIDCAGHYEFMTKKIKVHDCFGLFWLGRKNKGITYAMVLPEISEVPVKLGEGVKHFYGEAVAYDDAVEGRDNSEILGVREFRDGDKLQSVHWKLSARMDDLMVKENPLPKSCPIVIFMPGGAMAMNGSLNYVASLSFALMDLKCCHYLTWNSRSRNDVVRMRVDDEESFYLALTTFLRDGHTDCKDDRLERYREKYKGEPYLHVILADAEGRIGIDGEEPVKISEFQDELTLK